MVEKEYFMKQLKWRIKALLEFFQFQYRVFLAARKAQQPSPETVLPLCFIAGCGRSGTTMLGQLLSLHPAISYLNEPRAFWNAVSPRTDIWGYTKAREEAEGLLILSTKPGEAKRLCTLFHSKMEEPRHAMVLEKTPENVFRLPWLHALAPQAKLIHIVRNGPDVVHSILVEAGFDIPYGLGDMNNWYGSRDRKRRLLKLTSEKLAIPPSVLASCVTTEDWAALEWICSLNAYREWKDHFRLTGCYHLRYEDLLAAPWRFFCELIAFLGLTVEPELEEIVSGFVRAPRPAAVITISPGLREHFESEQRRFGYAEDYGQ